MIQSLIFSISYENCQIILLVMSGMILMQAITFVEIINYIFIHLNEWMNKKPNISNSFTTIEYLPRHFQHKYYNHVLEYHYIQLIYFKLWKISQMTSKYFGWNYLLIIIRNWLQAAHHMYGIFILCTNFGMDKSLLRKYEYILLFYLFFYFLSIFH